MTVKSLVIAVAVASIGVHAETIDVVSPELTGGKYYLYRNGAQVGNYKLQLHTSLAEAVRLSDECGCVITIKTPDITVKTKREPRVIEPTTKSVTIMWTRPTTRVNGQPLSVDEIHKYVISITNDTYTDILIDVVDATAEKYVIENLSVGTWSFKMAAVDTNGLSSVWTKSIQKEI